ncbi:hypothetical protein QA641_30225 [Bradyrhizobium sp. CB1650]|uniref:hypothetical protein n=1 Tax=Bradyrhizobium sp. CB1650 TaxID=3039153 RepID=UPI002435F617|nr:hypothetical protein [Bradyrhizobium sp. CB1650]WGD49891.1 hypothetical protein QA641_30225 [Bradyrhizobium sp. CB1650]
MPYGLPGWRLHAGDECRRARPGTWKRWTTGSGCTTGSATGDGPSVSTTTDGPSGGTAGHGASRRTGIPSTSHAAATGDGATSGAPHRLTAAAPDPTHCRAAASGPARGGTAA